MRGVLSALGEQCGVRYLGFKCLSTMSWEEAAEQVSQLVIVPEVLTWSRSRHRSVEGPRPYRDANWPWGFPWLSPREREQVDGVNDRLRRCFSLMNDCVRQRPSTHLLFIHPEDLGRADQGEPASIWRLPELRTWANRWGLRPLRNTPMSMLEIRLAFPHWCPLVPPAAAFAVLAWLADV